MAAGNIDLWAVDFWNKFSKRLLPEQLKKMKATDFNSAISGKGIVLTSNDIKVVDVWEKSSSTFEAKFPRVVSAATPSSSSSLPSGILGTSVGDMIGSSADIVKKTIGFDKTLSNRLGLDAAIGGLIKLPAESLLNSLSAPLEKILNTVLEKVSGSGPILSWLKTLGKNTSAILEGIMSHINDVSDQYEDIRWETLMIAQRTNEEFFENLHEEQKQSLNAMGVTRYRVMKEFIEASDQLSLRYNSKSAGYAKTETLRLAETSEKMKNLNIQNIKSLFEVFNTEFDVDVNRMHQILNRNIGFAEKSGVGFRKYFEDLERFSVAFVSELDENKIVDKFKKMEIAAKKMGMSAESVLEKMEKFDDISFSANAGGKINATLMNLTNGAVDFDFFKMLTLDPEERAKYLFGQLNKARAGLDAKFAGNDIGRRAAVKQIQEDFSGLGFSSQEVRKLLNKSNAANIQEFGNSGKYEQNLEDKGRLNELGSAIEILLRDSKRPQNYQEVIGDQVPSALISLLISLKKTTRQGDEAVYNSIVHSIEDVVNGPATATAKAQLKLAEELAAKSTDNAELAKDIIPQIMKALGNTGENLNKTLSLDPSVANRKTLDNPSGSSATLTPSDIKTKENSLTNLDRSLGKSGDTMLASASSFRESVVLISKAAEKLSNIKITVVGKDDKSMHIALSDTFGGAKYA